MPDPMRIRAVMMGEVVDVKILMSHVMETGQRKDADGNVVPAHYITEVTATCKDKTVMSAAWGPSVAKNPYFSFRFKGGAKGDKLSITWKDTAGGTRTDEVTIN
ncbi:MAG: thiosulfate oxidation carrier complex protein SoxZ [Gammaproteobacteria bacterium]|nr:thiosulfate oxidation carrier complex protein SoxZ [Gammaproteobacteria bacterium]